MSTISPKLIQDLSKRKVTSSKRKRGLIKKAIELSERCGLDIFLVIFNKEKQTFTSLNSHQDFDQEVVSHIMDNVNRQQFFSKSYTNKDFPQFKLDKDDEETYKVNSKTEAESFLNKRGNKCYKKEQEFIIKRLQSNEFYEKKSLAEKLDQFIAPQNQAAKHKKRFEIASQTKTQLSQKNVQAIIQDNLTQSISDKLVERLTQRVQDIETQLESCHKMQVFENQSKLETPIKTSEEKTSRNKRPIFKIWKNSTDVTQTEESDSQPQHRGKKLQKYDYPRHKNCYKSAEIRQNKLNDNFFDLRSIQSDMIALEYPNFSVCSVSQQNSFDFKDE